MGTIVSMVCALPSCIYSFGLPAFRLHQQGSLYHYEKRRRLCPARRKLTAPPPEAPS
jgi:hypothetical protein